MITRSMSRSQKEASNPKPPSSRGENAGRVRLVRIKGDGDCFFKCISIAFNIPVISLRKIVAASIFVPENRDSVLNWKHMYNSIPRVGGCQLLKNTVKHLVGVEKGTDSLTPSEMDVIYENMLKSTYWGDEYCIKVLSETLSLNIVVRDSSTSTFWTPHHSGDRRNSIFLKFNGINHYDLLKIDGKFLCSSKKKY